MSTGSSRTNPSSSFLRHLTCHVCEMKVHFEELPAVRSVEKLLFQFVWTSLCSQIDAIVIELSDKDTTSLRPLSVVFFSVYASSVQSGLRIAILQYPKGEFRLACGHSTNLKNANLAIASQGIRNAETPQFSSGVCTPVVLNCVSMTKIVRRKAKVRPTILYIRPVNVKIL